MNKQTLHDQPLVSICIPVYNSARFLRKSLDSIVNQTYPNKEIIVSDNASTDGTEEIIKEYVENIKYHRNRRNIGAEANFSRCIELANGEFIAIYHSDDIYDKEIVARQIAYLNEHPDSGAIFTSAHIIDEEGNLIRNLHIPRELIKDKSYEYNFEKVFRAIMKHGNFLICPSAMVKADIYKNEIKNYRHDMFKSSSDLDVWLRILEKHNIGILPISLMNYRHSKTQGSFRYGHLRIKPSDFFLVMDYYLLKKWVTSKIHDNDMRYYDFLRRKDDLNRAISFLAKNDSQNAYNLTHRLFNLKLLGIAFSNFSRFEVYVAGILLFLFLQIGIGKTAGVFLYKLFMKFKK